MLKPRCLTGLLQDWVWRASPSAEPAARADVPEQTEDENDQSTKLDREGVEVSSHAVVGGVVGGVLNNDRAADGDLLVKRARQHVLPSIALTRGDRERV